MRSFPSSPKSTFEPCWTAGEYPTVYSIFREKPVLLIIPKFVTYFVQISHQINGAYRRICAPLLRSTVQGVPRFSAHMCRASRCELNWVVRTIGQQQLGHLLLPLLNFIPLLGSSHATISDAGALSWILL